MTREKWWMNRFFANICIKVPLCLCQKGRDTLSGQLGHLISRRVICPFLERGASGNPQSLPFLTRDSSSEWCGYVWCIGFFFAFNPHSDRGPFLFFLSRFLRRFIFKIMRKRKKYWEAFSIFEMKRTAGDSFTSFLSRRCFFFFFFLCNEEEHSKVSCVFQTRARGLGVESITVNFLGRSSLLSRWGNVVCVRGTGVLCAFSSQDCRKWPFLLFSTFYFFRRGYYHYCCIFGHLFSSSWRFFDFHMIGGHLFLPWGSPGVPN